jgi:hypothetical protein
MSAAHSAEIHLVPSSGGHGFACESCGKPVDSQQRYCIHCGARRADVEDPAIAWMATRKQRAAGNAMPASGAAPRNPLALPALVLLLLPVVAAIGVIAGRGGGDASTDPQLLQALKSQKAPIVRVGGVAGGGVATAARTGAKKKAKASHAKHAKKDATGGKVVARTRYGVAHQISGFKPTAAKVNSDRKLVQKINKSIGKNYLEAQKNLPDTIVVPTGTTGGGSTPTATGRGD